MIFLIMIGALWVISCLLNMVASVGISLEQAKKERLTRELMNDILSGRVNGAERDERIKRL